jgi:uncharacterized C2H2 Zn-finger protein
MEFDYAKELVNHKQIDHLPKEILDKKEGKSVLECGFCGQVFLIKKSMQRHVQRKHNGQQELVKNDENELKKRIILLEKENHQLRQEVKGLKSKIEEKNMIITALENSLSKGHKELYGKDQCNSREDNFEEEFSNILAPKGSKAQKFWKKTWKIMPLFLEVLITK